jgi:hypothetical protein
MAKKKKDDAVAVTMPPMAAGPQLVPAISYLPKSASADGHIDRQDIYQFDRDYFRVYERQRAAVSEPQAWAAGCGVSSMALQPIPDTQPTVPSLKYRGEDIARIFEEEFDRAVREEVHNFASNSEDMELTHCGLVAAMRPNDWVMMHAQSLTTAVIDDGMRMTVAAPALRCTAMDSAYKAMGMTEEARKAQDIEVMRIDEWNDYFGGHFFTPWQGFQSFMRYAIGYILPPDVEARAVTYQAAATNCGYWWPGTFVAVVSGRPLELHTQLAGDRLVLHNTEGPAAVWPDGFKIFYINGIAMDEQMVMFPHTMTVKMMQTETNEDRRSLCMERFGFDRYIAEVGAKVLDQAHDDVENTDKVLLQTNETPPQVLMSVVCPTGRLFFLPVEGNIKTVQEAMTMLYPPLAEVLGQDSVLSKITVNPLGRT